VGSQVDMKDLKMVQVESSHQDFKNKNMIDLAEEEVKEEMFRNQINFNNIIIYLKRRTRHPL
jgi:hypothetical protein